jgi:acyl-CoA thioester hydrolase
MYISTTQLRVRYAETDQMNIVYYGNYAQYFEVGRVEAIRQLGFSYKNIEATGIIMPVVEMQVKYVRPARYDDLITIKTTLRELPTSHKITFYQEVLNEQEKLLTAGTVRLYFIDSKTFQRASIPEKLKEKLAVFFSTETADNTILDDNLPSSF